MKPLRVPVEALKIGEHLLDRDASHYVLNVHRCRPGMPLVLFDAAHGIEADATLVATAGKAALCQVETLRASRAVPTHPVTLVQSLSKGDKLDRVVRDATALGVTRIVAVAATRSIVHVDPSDALERRQRWSRIAVEAARQSGRGNVPEIIGPLDLAEGAGVVEDCSLRLLLSPHAQTRLGAVLVGHAAVPVAVCIGPEGGFDDEECGLLVARGFEPVRFGDFVLRTETAATAVLGALTDWAAR